MNIVKYPNDWLNKICDPFDFEKDPDPKPLVKDMIETMLANKGIGLAATQIEYDKAVFGINRTTVKWALICSKPWTSHILHFMWNRYRLVRDIKATTSCQKAMSQQPPTSELRL